MKPVPLWNYQNNRFLCFKKKLCWVWCNTSVSWSKPAETLNLFKKSTEG